MTFAARAILAAFACVLPALPALAQEWPTKPVKVIVPFPPGGGTDTVARPLAAKLSTLSGQQFVTDNRGGAGGTIGATVAARSPADGYTLLLAPVHLAVAVSAYKNLQYDLEKDLLPVTTLAIFPDVLVAATKVPAKTLPELIAYAKANEGKVNCGSAGNGTTRHLSCEMFNAQAGVKTLHVPYKGTGPATTALLGGEVDFIFEALGSASGHIRAGKLRAIAVTSAKRSPSFPEIPTAMESGLPGFEVTSWYGLWAPAGTARPVIQRLHALVAKAFEEQDMRDLWFKLGAEPGGASPEQFAAFVRTEVVKWGKVVRDAKVTIE
ncbi:MAG: tripartite tricarboxylate transporter substrate binding protein [Betaproteobacteria bacterium]|nr:tripartite tricarboxylate transporter substrate binding protein [Betaproteobacteria bacterium]